MGRFLVNRPQSMAEWILFAVFIGSLLTMVGEIAWWTVRGY